MRYHPNCRRALAAVACMLAIAATAFPAGAATTSAPTATGAAVGVVSDLTWGISRTDMERSVSMMRDAGVRWARLNIGWSAIERDGKGRVNSGWLAEIDAAVASARSAGIQVLMPIADGVPYWASADPAKYQDPSGQYWNKLWRPSNPQDYADFARFVVARYKDQGVHTFEVWNEPNHPYFWPSGPRASEYVSLLAAAYPLIKQADPEATVVLGGLSGNDATYMDAIYAAGGKPYFDIAAVHPYTGSVNPLLCWTDAIGRQAKDAFCGIEAVRATMVANGDSAKNMWLTEFGWSTTTSTYGVSEALQASYLTNAFTKLQDYPYVTAAFWYNFRNTYWLNDAPNMYEANAGLVRTDFSPKPSYAALQLRAQATTVTTPSPPAAPVGLVASSISSSEIDLTWTGTTAAQRYTVQRSSDATPWVDIGTVVAPITRYADTGLSRATMYSYRVRAENDAGSSSYSIVALGKTKRR